METRDFCYWLQGFFELDGHDGLNADQVIKIKQKLDECFVHEAMGDNSLSPTEKLASRKRRC
jgi:hypothetical protein